MKCSLGSVVVDSHVDAHRNVSISQSLCESGGVQRFVDIVWRLESPDTIYVSSGGLLFDFAGKTIVEDVVEVSCTILLATLFVNF